MTHYPDGDACDDEKGPPPQIDVLLVLSLLRSHILLSFVPFSSPPPPFVRPSTITPDRPSITDL